MKYTNKKGFTLVELVIVIAVIAILAGVLIGTFATVLTNANKSKAMQEAKAAWDEFLVELDYTNKDEVALATSSFVIKSGTYFFAVNKGRFDATAYDTEVAVMKAITGEDLTKENNWKDSALTGSETTGKYFVRQTAPSNFYLLKVVS